MNEEYYIGQKWYKVCSISLSITEFNISTKSVGIDSIAWELLDIDGVECCMYDDSLSYSMYWYNSYEEAKVKLLACIDKSIKAGLIHFQNALIAKERYFE